MKPFLTRGGALRGNAAPVATLHTVAATLLRIESRDACILGLRNSRHENLMLMAGFSLIVIKLKVINCGVTKLQVIKLYVTKM